MTDILVRVLSVARKPRSLRDCTECSEPTYPGLPRYRCQFWQDGNEHDGHFHVHCLMPWLTRYLRAHRETLKPKGTKK